MTDAFAPAMDLDVFNADYVPENDPMHTGNPLVDTLPRIRSDAEWVAQLLRAPAFDLNERKLEAHLRSYKVSKLKRLFIPTPQHYKFGRRLDQLIRCGYEHRNPLLPARAALLQAAFERMQRSGEATPIVFTDADPMWSYALIGCSGAGKSTTAESVLGSYPQRIFHPHYNITQVVWIKVDCPKGGGIRDLALSFVQAFDKVLGQKGNNYSRMNAQELTALAHLLAVAHHLGVVVLDELQNLSAKKSGGREEMLNWFQELVNLFKLPVVLLGTYKAKAVLQLDLRHGRRAGVTGSEIWDPLKRGPEFDYLMKKIWYYSWLRNVGELTEELLQAIYEETQGIRAFMVDMFLVVQLHALWKGLETITPELFKSVARAEFSTVQPMLNALRSKDPNRQKKFEDLVSYDVEEAIERILHLVSSGSPPVSSVARSSESTLLGQACCNIETALGLSAAESKQLVLRAMDGSHKSARALTTAALRLYCRITEDAPKEEGALDVDL